MGHVEGLMTTKKTYRPAGLPSVESQSISDAAIAYVNMLMVSRSGTLLNQTDNPALLNDGGLFYLYNPSYGMLTFGYPFNSGEDIEIVYKTI